MNRRDILGISAATALGAIAPERAVAQLKPESLKSQLVGWWRLVSVESNLSNGTKKHAFGANPKGLLVFGATGLFSDVKEAAGRAKFKSDNRGAATLEESKEATSHTFFQFGRWSVNEADRSFVFHAEGALAPNIEGVDSSRVVTVINDTELKFVDPGAGGSTTAAAGGTTEFYFHRVA